MDVDPEDVKAQFNAAAPSYGGWHGGYAERLIALTPLDQGQRVLDVGTGTGLAAIAAAKAVGPAGSVVGIDVAEGMIGQARRAAAKDRLANVTFEVADARQLPFANGSFDAVVCSSAIIYLPLAVATREWWRVLRPGGVAAFSTLGSDSPRSGAVFRRVASAFGLALDNPNAIGSPAECRALLTAAGFAEIVVTQEAITADRSTPHAAWEANINSAVFATARRLPTTTLARMRDAYLSALTVADLDAPYTALYVVARRPYDEPATPHQVTFADTD